MFAPPPTLGEPHHDTAGSTRRCDRHFGRRSRRADAVRGPTVMGVSIMMDEARRIHGQGWPQWTYIQTFGGPESDNGVWAVPLPHELRFMTYQALVHRATGILYFSYWPQQPRTWQSLATLNRELQTLVPRLVSPGRDAMLNADNASIQVRMRTSADKKSGLI